MRPTTCILHALCLAIALLGDCVSIEIDASVPNDSAPRIAGYSLDQAAVACLDWAWSVKRAREVAGGVVVDDEGELACSPLTLGSVNAVEYDVGSLWLVHFHTHVGPGRASPQDRETVARLDPLHRPSYVRDPSGVVWVYECAPQRHDPACRERRIPRVPAP